MVFLSVFDVYSTYGKHVNHTLNIRNIFYCVNMHIALRKIWNNCDFNLDITLNWVTEKKICMKKKPFRKKSNKSPHTNHKISKGIIMWTLFTLRYYASRIIIVLFRGFANVQVVYICILCILFKLTVIDSITSK